MHTNGCNFLEANLPPIDPPLTRGFVPRGLPSAGRHLNDVWWDFDLGKGNCGRGGGERHDARVKNNHFASHDKRGSEKQRRAVATVVVDGVSEPNQNNCAIKHCWRVLLVGEGRGTY